MVGKQNSKLPITVLWDCTAERVAFTLNHMLRLSVGPVNPFNSQYLSRLGGTAGEGVLSIQYLFGPEWNTSLSRMLVFFPLFIFCSEAFQSTSKEVSRLCFPGCAI